jgi:hypothetical protein
MNGPNAVLLGLLGIAAAGQHLCHGASETGGRYRIRFNWLCHVGDRYKFKVRGSMERRVFESRLPRMADKIEVHETWVTWLRGTETVVAVDEAGEPTALSVSVAQSQSDQGTGPMQLVAPGTELAVMSEGGVLVVKEGSKRLEGATLEALELVLEVHTPGHLHDDDVLGLDRPVAVGEQWPISSELLARGVREQQLVVVGQPSRVSGNMQFLGTSRLGSTLCAHVSGEIERLNLSQPPSGYELTGAFSTKRFSGYLPLDRRLPDLETDVDFVRRRVGRMPSRLAEGPRWWTIEIRERWTRHEQVALVGEEFAPEQDPKPELPRF